MSSSPVIKLPDPRVAAFASSITEPMEGTTWWNGNEGGVIYAGGNIFGIRSDGQGHGDYLSDGIMITRLSTQNSNAANTHKDREFRYRVKLAMDTCQRQLPDKCETCQKRIIARYEGSPPVCGYPLCDKADIAQAAGTYNKQWLGARQSQSHVPPFTVSLLPGPPQPMSKEDIVACFNGRRNASLRVNWTGWTCPNCKRLNLRIYWNRYECRNCKSCYPYGMPNFSFEELVSPEWRCMLPEDVVPRLIYKDYISYYTSPRHRKWVLRVFRLDDENTVVVGIPRESAIRSPGGFKSLFDEL
ncbi:hypothetical protein PG997_014534 [Apiospora hydei]|uniref:RanBP2-type domain-containing protein n=1 Tax=Apiospora hydei TaxID=1337664 RepID=A0ABR1UUQ7_9PEZI